jgi:hypothetical protein
VFERPPTSDILRLAQCSVYLTANPHDPSWNGDKGFVVSVFQPNGDNARILLDDMTLTWWPRYPKDWKTHPRVCRVLEFIRYYPKSSGSSFGVAIQPVPPGRYCMVVQAQWRQMLTTGSKTSADLYEWLVGTHPHMS